MAPFPRPSASAPGLRALARCGAAVLVALGVVGPAHALYKVVGPDGRITYTDRPPPTGSAQGRVTSLSAAGATSSVADPAASLPAELRQPVTRYPVTLYVTGSCAPCDSARGLLRQRGVPFAEKMIATEEDAEALQRLAGTRDVPTLTVGAQVVRGLTADAWQGYLDSAGYPRESRLPAGYVWPSPTPVVERRDASPQPGAAPARADGGTGSPAPGNAIGNGGTPPPVSPAPGGIRF